MSRAEKTGEENKTGGEAAYTFSLPFVLQKEVGCGAKPHEVKDNHYTEAGEAAASGVEES